MRCNKFSRLRHTSIKTCKRILWFPVLALAAFLLANPSIVAADPDTDRQTSERVAALLGKMTLPEKIGQLNLVSQGEPVAEQLEAVARQMT